MSVNLFQAPEDRPPLYVETVFEKTIRCIEADEKVEHKTVAKVFALIAYFITAIIPLIDAFIAIADAVICRVDARLTSMVNNKVGRSQHAR